MKKKDIAVVGVVPRATAVERMHGVLDNYIQFQDDYKKTKIDSERLGRKIDRDIYKYIMDYKPFMNHTWTLSASESYDFMTVLTDKPFRLFLSRLHTDYFISFPNDHYVKFIRLNCDGKGECRIKMDQERTFDPFVPYNDLMVMFIDFAKKEWNARFTADMKTKVLLKDSLVRQKSIYDSAVKLHDLFVNKRTK